LSAAAQANDLAASQKQTSIPIISPRVIRLVDDGLTHEALKTLEYNYNNAASNTIAPAN